MTEKHTRIACYLGMITQAVSINFPALLYVVFHQEYGVSFSALGTLVVMIFAAQMLVDIWCAHNVERIGYRAASVAAAGFSAAGMLLLPLLVTTLPPPLVFPGIVVALLLTAIGSGFLEVIVSPLIEALPSRRKAADMAILHAAYCWGFVICVLGSTAFFALFGLRRWPLLAVLWSILPLIGTYLFAFAPLRSPVAEGQQAMRLGELFRSRAFPLMLLMMVCGGAAEQAMAQWASLFAQLGMGVSKTAGDLLGPLLFAVLMGSSRTYYGVRCSSLDLKKELRRCALLGVCGYLLAVFGQHPILCLVGCGVCGYAVGIFWPGTISLSAKFFPLGGSAMFSLLAMGGDIGCMLGPGLVGWVSDGIQGLYAHATGFAGMVTRLLGTAENVQMSLKTGLLTALLFPVGILLLLRVVRRLSRGA